MQQILAKYYAGASYLQKGSFSSAALSLKTLVATTYLVQARAYSLTGDAYSELKDYAKAISAYKKAVDEKPNEEFTPIYAMKLASAYEANGEMKKAAEAYALIIDEYSKSNFLPEAKETEGKIGRTSCPIIFKNQ